MRRIILLLAALAACGDNIKPSTRDGGLDGAVDAPSGRLTGCLDLPDQLPAAPTGQLPCDLIPPGLTP
jgi:hypothetical protein